MTVKKIIGQIHLWLGLASGLVVFILGITGCLYAFIDEIRPLVYKDRLYVDVPLNAKMAPFALIRANAQRAVGQEHPFIDAELSTLPGHTVSFRSRKFDENAILYSDFYKYYYHVYVNPYTAQVVKVQNSKWEFFNMDVAMHTSLFLGGPGRLIVEYSVLFFVILLITGIVLWWPKNRKAAKQRFWFRWKESTKFKRKNYDLHNILGFYSLFIALIISLTGLVWSFEWAANSINWLGNGGKLSAPPKALFSDTTTSKMASLDRVIQDGIRRSPKADDFFISFPEDKKSTIAIYARAAGQPNYQSISSEYDQHTGKLLDLRRYESMSGGEKIIAMNYDLHTGGVLGLTGKFLAFFGSLIAASLPVTGFLIWWGKRKNNGRKSKPISMLKRRASFQ